MATQRAPFFTALDFLIRVGLGSTLLLIAIPKLQMPYKFLSSIYGFEMVGPKVGAFLAVSLPWLELALAVLLLGDILVRAALLLSAALGALFTCAQASAIHRGLEISCGCFSQAEPGKISYATLGKAIFVFLAAVFAYFVSVSEARHDHTHPRSTET